METYAVWIVFEVFFLAHVYARDLYVLQGGVLATHDNISADTELKARCYAGQNPFHIRAFLATSAHTELVLRLPGYATSPPFAGGIGLTQGDPEASLLFNDMMASVFKPLHIKWTAQDYGFALPHAAWSLSHTFCC